MMLLVLLTSLLAIATGTVYIVTPDHDYNGHYYPNNTCEDCYSLQLILLNVTKYFTSNTQLYSFSQENIPFIVKLLYKMFTTFPLSVLMEQWFIFSTRVML